MVDLAKIYVVTYLKKHGIVASLEKDKSFFGLYKRKTGERLLDKFAFDGSDEDIQKYAEDVTTHFGGTPATLIEKIQKRMQEARKKVEERIKETGQDQNTSEQPVQEETASEKDVVESRNEEILAEQPKEEEKQQKVNETSAEEKKVESKRKTVNVQVLRKMKEQMRKEERDFRRIKSYKEEEREEEKQPQQPKESTIQQPTSQSFQINWLYVILGLVFAVGMYFVFKMFMSKNQQPQAPTVSYPVSEPPSIQQVEVKSSKVYWRDL